tara:strand:+ start:1669 stop:1995 length:327 start_codon:yes stop_codon:yes gene_type:complete
MTYSGTPEERKAKARLYERTRTQKKKEYRQTPSGKKAMRIHNWKSRGVLHDNFDELYEKYLNTELCESCSCVLTTDKKNTSTHRCLDHCHETGQFRNVICNGCNLRRR